MAQDVEKTQVEDRGDDLAPTVDEIIEKADEKLAETTPKAKENVEKAEETVETTPERDEKGKFIPKARFDEAVTKEREKAAALQARNAELESHLAAQVTSQDITEAQKIVRDLIKQRNSHLGDGELDKATEIDSKIVELQEAIADRKAELKVESARSSAVEAMKYDAVVERLEEEHPELNPDSDEYDDEIATEIRALMKGYQSELRLTPAAALRRAAGRVFGTTKAKEDSKVADEGVRRKAEATERNLDAAKKQPASTKDVGLDHDKKGGGLDSKTVMSMKYDEFIKLGDDVLSRLRGDSL